MLSALSGDRMRRSSALSAAETASAGPHTRTSWRRTARVTRISNHIKSKHITSNQIKFISRRTAPALRTRPASGRRGTARRPAEPSSPPGRRSLHVHNARHAGYLSRLLPGPRSRLNFKHTYGEGELQPQCIQCSRRRLAARAHTSTDVRRCAVAPRLHRPRVRGGHRKRHRVCVPHAQAVSAMSNQRLARVAKVGPA